MFKIVSIQRVQNRPCYRAFAIKRKLMQERQGTEATVDERFLYHGTREVDPLTVAADPNG